jgi:hypothetical protein
MPEPKTLRVLVRGAAMVPDYEALENPYGSTRKFIGRAHDKTLGEEFVDPETKQKGRQGGFVALIGEVVEVPNRVEYRLHVQRHQDLWAADEATAQACGVAFDPSFGGEHPPAAAKGAPARPGASPAPSTPSAAEAPQRAAKGA